MGNCCSSTIIDQIYDRITPCEKLVFKPEFANDNIISELINRSKEITTPPVAAKVGWFVKEVAALRKDLVTSAAIRDMLVETLKKHALAPDSVRFVSVGIATIVGNNPQGQRLFSTSECASAMLEALKKHATTPIAVKWVSVAVYMIIKDNPLGINHFATPPFVEEFKKIGRYANELTCPESEQWFNSTFHLLKGIESSPFIDRILDETTSITSLIIYDRIKDEYRNEKVVSELVSRSEEITSPFVTEKVGWFVAWVASKRKDLVSSLAIRDMIVEALKKYATTPDSVRDVCLAIGNITLDNPEGQRLFSTPECASVIITALKKYATTPESVQRAAIAIGNIAGANPEGQRLFATAELAAVSTEALRKYATAPDAVENVGLAIAQVTANNPEGRPLFSTQECTSAIVAALRKHTGSPTILRNLVLSINNIAVNNPDGQRLFSTPECASVVVEALKKYATTTENVQYVCLAIKQIVVNNPDGQRLFSTPECVEAFVEVLIRKYVTTPDCVLYFSAAVHWIVHNNPGGLKLFATPSFIGEFRKIDWYATTENSKKEFNNALGVFMKGLPHEIDQIFDQTTLLENLMWKIEYLNNDAVSELVSRSKQITSALVAAKVGWIIGKIASTRQDLVTSDPIRDIIVTALAQYGTTPSSVENLGRAIVNITANNPVGQRLFSTPESASAIVVAFKKYATTPSSVQHVCLAIARITTNNLEGQRLFSTPECATAIIEILKKYATTADSVENISLAIGRITSMNPEGKRLFSTPECASAIVTALKKYGTTPESVKNVSLAIVNITAKNFGAQRLFSTPECVEALVEVLIRKYVTTPDCVLYFSSAIFRIADGNPGGLKLFATPSFIDEFRKIERYATTENSKTDFNNTLHLLEGGLHSNPPATNNSSPPNQQQQQQQQQPPTKVSPASRAENNHDSTIGHVSSMEPPVFIFKRGVPENLSFNDSVGSCLGFHELPKNEKGEVTRPDLKDFVPDESDARAVLQQLERDLPRLKERQSVKKLIAENGITDDDIRALWLYKSEDPYPVYKWLNAHLMGQRRDDKIKQTMGPIFVRIYRAMEKLPKITCKVTRAALVKNIPALRSAFNNYEERFKPGQIVSFWGFGSFSRDDSVGAMKFAGDMDEDAIIYSCPAMEGVDMEPFAPTGMGSEAEILPMCPAVFESTGALKVMNTKLVITLKQLKHEEYAYVAPHK